jgi:glutaredoxin
VPIPRLTLISKPGCHLCDDARTVLATVSAEFPGVGITELSILQDPELFELYSDEIPVVLIDGKVHNIWRVSAERLRAALTDATRF